MKQTEDEIGTGYSLAPCWKVIVEIIHFIFFEWSIYNFSIFQAFIYLRYGNVLGCVIAEPNIQAHRAIHSNGIILLSEDSCPVKCGINRIWVKREFRGQKVATNLMNCLRLVNEILWIELKITSFKLRLSFFTEKTSFTENIWNSTTSLSQWRPPMVTNLPRITPVVRITWLIPDRI